MIPSHGSLSISLWRTTVSFGLFHLHIHLHLSSRCRLANLYDSHPKLSRGSSSATASRLFLTSQPSQPKTTNESIRSKPLKRLGASTSCFGLTVASPRPATAALHALFLIPCLFPTLTNDAVLNTESLFASLGLQGGCVSQAMLSSEGLNQRSPGKES